MYIYIHMYIYNLYVVKIFFQCTESMHIFFSLLFLAGLKIRGASFFGLLDFATEIIVGGGSLCFACTMHVLSPRDLLWYLPFLTSHPRYQSEFQKTNCSFACFVQAVTKNRNMNVPGWLGFIIEKTYGNSKNSSAQGVADNTWHKRIQKGLINRLILSCTWFSLDLTSLSKVFCSVSACALPILLSAVEINFVNVAIAAVRWGHIWHWGETELRWCRGCRAPATPRWRSPPLW